MAKLKLKKGDTVKVISGESRGSQGKILSIDIKKNRATVEGVNLVSKSEKPNAKNTNGGIVKKEGSIHLSNLMLLVDGKTVRVGRKLDEKTNKLVRISKKTKEVIK
ncbi:MAG: 50S ribosomal protein L24 [Bacteroidota bacterium]|jgi:large subunit ribosomal protein L24|nr:50S ribosomal protein L24 [Bacteroidota bacterium]MCA6443027.1 50S ribosomal protein L24 [Bacteroidota bacterium]